MSSVVVVGVASPSGAAYMRGGGRCPEDPAEMRNSTRLHHPGTHLICWWSHRSRPTVAVLLTTLGKKETDFQLFFLCFHNGDILEMVSVQW